MSRICSEAAACSVHAEMSCWVRLLAAGRSSRTIGWIAIGEGESVGGKVILG